MTNEEDQLGAQRLLRQVNAEQLARTVVRSLNATSVVR
jgi:hypothetical protein